MIANEPDCFGNFFPDPNCYACLCHEECEEAKQQDLIDKSNFKNDAFDDGYDYDGWQARIL